MSVFFFLSACGTDGESFFVERSAAGSGSSLAEIAARVPADHPARAEIGGGIRLLQEGRADRANTLVDRALKRNPTDGSLHFLNCIAYLMKAEDGNRANLELAETGCLLALKFEPGNVWSAYLLGHIAYRAQRYVDAGNFFAYGVLYEPGNTELLKGLLVSAYAARELTTAVWAAKRLETLAGGDSASLRNAALAYAATGHFEGARTSLAAYRDIVPAAETTHGYRALQRRVEEWESYFRRNDLPQLAQSDALPFEDRLRPRDRGAQTDTSPGVPSAGPQPAGTAPGTAADQGPKMVLVDVAIIRTEETRSSRRGVNLLAGLEATLGGTLYGLEFTRTRTSGTGGSSRDTSVEHTISPTFTLAGLTYNLNIFNDGVERAEILARPSLLAVENKPSEFFSGGVWHVELTSNLSYGSVEPVSIGLNLKVTPQFLSDELLLLDVSAERSFLQQRSADIGFTAFSETTKTSVSATAKLRFGETLILSGLSEYTSDRERDGVPFLERIPGVQYLFSQRTEQTVKRSVLILLTPREARFFDGPDTSEAARQAALRDPQDDRFKTELKKREGIRPNLDAVYAGLELSDYYRQFRSGDMRMDSWRDRGGMERVLRSFLDLLYF